MVKRHALALEKQAYWRCRELANNLNLTRFRGHLILTEEGVLNAKSIAFGNGVSSQPTESLFFTAGLNGEADGLYGRIDPGAGGRERDDDDD